MTGIESFLIATTALSTITGAVGSFAGASQARAQAANQAAMYEYEGQIQQNNALIAERNAKISQDKANYDIARHRENLLRIRGQQSAGFSAAGVALEGTPIDVFDETNIQGELDALNIQYGSTLEQQDYALKAQGFRTDAEVSKYKAYAATQEGKIKAMNSTVSGIGTLLGGAAQTGYMGYRLYQSRRPASIG